LVVRTIADGEHVRTCDLGKLPPSIVTDWASPLLDGDLPLDVSIDVAPLDLAWAKLQLDTRRNALESSQATPGRMVALEQIGALRMAYERRRTLPMRMSVTIAVRAPDRQVLERRTKRLRQRVKDLGAEVRLLRWEQRAGWLAVLPVRRQPLPRRGLPVETGTVARTYPWSAGTLAIEGGVPFGVAASTVVTFTTAAPRNKNRHMCWYGTSGAGKGYSLRVLLSRERFANGLRIYGIDQDEQQEYAGRFCDYLGGIRVPIRSVAEAEAFSFAQTERAKLTISAAFSEIGSERQNNELRRVGSEDIADVVIWDLHESDEHDRGTIFAILKTRLVEHLLEHPGRAAFIVSGRPASVRRARPRSPSPPRRTSRSTCSRSASPTGSTVASAARSRASRHPNGSARWRRASCTRLRPAWVFHPRNATASKRPARAKACS
jgi:hypothetical protein